MDYKNELAQLREELSQADYRYYVLDDPTIPDYEYDQKLRRLEELEAAHPEEITPDSPTQRVGGAALESFQQLSHPVPLESLQDVFSSEEVLEFGERMDLVLEDAAHAFGAMYKGRKIGTIGDFAAFSFHEVKNITSFGEGGIATTNIPDFGAEMKRARFLGLDFSA
ncbi:MAG: DegT/DnrJ/EryC1/StrS family aminotransferase, partial [Oscillospiraceae bacterium]|nr:DegT/DnrJ/EryC1/StrS family aminotransferase [Oscillospiraceae bacterium]